MTSEHWADYCKTFHWPYCKLKGIDFSVIICWSKLKDLAQNIALLHIVNVYA
jgi:hypothetical protein